MKKLQVFQIIGTVLMLLGITTVVYLYSAGYRLQKDTQSKRIDLTQTGMVGAKSIPEGANVYLDGILLGATNDTISGVEPGMHHLKIVKKGFVAWEKDIEVFNELVTDITAVLVSQTPRLEPLTGTTAFLPSISPTLSKLAYFSKEDQKPGIYIISLNNLGFFKSDPTFVIPDTKYIKYSNGVSIEWSPDETSLLVEGENKTFYIINISSGSAVTSTNPQNIRDQWKTEILNKRTEFIAKLNLSDEIKNLASKDNVMWSPDDKKFLYTVNSNDKTEYKIYNLEVPLPVGEKAETTVFTTNTNDPQPIISWYPDSYHLVMVEGDVQTNKKGTISMIRIDGTNKTEVYSNTLHTNKVFSAPGGDKIVISTSYRSDDRSDLYTVSIR